MSIIPPFDPLRSLPLDEHLAILASSERLPTFSITLCAARYAEAAPTLRGILERAATGAVLDGDEALLFFRGLHIIAGCRDSLAFKPLLRFLRRPPQEVEELLGAATTETLPQIVTDVFDGDVAALLDAIVDVKIDDAVRDSLFRAATFLTWEGRIPRQFFIEFLERFYRERLAPDGDMAWFGWMNAIALLGLHDMRPMVLAAHEMRTLADLYWEPEFFEGDLAAAERAPNDIERFKQAHLGHIDDIVGSLNRFDTGDDEAFLRTGSGRTDRRSRRISRGKSLAQCRAKRSLSLRQRQKSQALLPRGLSRRREVPDAQARRCLAGRRRAHAVRQGRWPAAGLDAIELSVPVARHMVGLLKGGRPDFAVWGAVVPSLMWSNIAREVLMDAGIDPTTPAFSTVMACSTSMMGAIEAAGMIDGDASISRWSAASTA